MVDYEHTMSESGLRASFKKGGGSQLDHISHVTRTVSENERKAREKANKKRNEERYGPNQSIYLIGRNVRLAGRSYEPPIDEEEAKSYYKGYVDGGNEQLALTISNCMTELVTRARFGFRYGDFNPNSNGFMTLEELLLNKTPEYLHDIGYNDGKENIIDFEKLPDIIKNNVDYVEGYEEATRKNKIGK